MYVLVEKEQNEYLSSLLSGGLYDIYILIVLILTGKLINGGLYMSALVLLILLNKLGKRDKM